MAQGAHGGLYYLGTVYVYRIHTADNVLYPEPVGHPYDGTQVARVLYAVEGEYEGLRRTNIFQSVFRLFEYGQYILGCFKETGFTQVVIVGLQQFLGGDVSLGGHPRGFGDNQFAWECTHHVGHHFVSFCHKRLVLVAVFLHLEGADILDFRLTQHLFSFYKTNVQEII